MTPGRALVASIAITLSALGCATPAPLVRLHPRGPDVVWSSGRAVVAQSKDGITVAAAFDHQSEDLLAIEIEVQNGGDQRVEISPSNVTFITCRGDAIASCGIAHTVIDPEEVIDTLEARRSVEVADATNSDRAFAPLLLLSAVADVGAVASGHPDRAQNTASTAALANESAAEHAGAIGDIDARRAQWSAALRRTTLDPGQAAGGPVYLPIHRGARLVWLGVRLAGHRFTFCFEQQMREVIP